MRIEDALAATRAAVEEGIVPGGGVASLHAAKAVAKAIDSIEGDIKTGMQIVMRALEEPLRQIAFNAGLEGSVIVDKIKTANDTNYGYDAAKNEYGDMVAKGIIDPTKVTRSAIQNAASIASMLLTTESIVTDIPEEKGAAMPAAPGGMPGMY